VCPEGSEQTKAHFPVSPAGNGRGGGTYPLGDPDGALSL
jgi:hypothetical protein